MSPGTMECKLTSIWIFILCISVCQPSRTPAWDDPDHFPLVRAMADEVRKDPDLLNGPLIKAGLGEASRKIVDTLQKVHKDPRLLCASCQRLVPIAKSITESMSWAAVKIILVPACISAASLVTPNAGVLCRGILNTQGPVVYEIIKDERTTAETLCRSLSLCVETPPIQKHEPVVPPAVMRTPWSRWWNRHRSEFSRKTRQAEDPIRVVQLTDIHIDPRYAVGAPTDCGLAICCREDWEGEGISDMYGEYGCGLPQRTIQLVLNYANSLNPHFILHSGDNPPRAMWDETEQTQLEDNRLVYDMLLDTLGGYSIFAAIGNHETYPTNLYSPEDHPESLTTNELFAEYWPALGGLDVSQTENILTAAYYTHLIQPGLRIITYNTLFMYHHNYFNAMHDHSTVKANMKTFIENTLQFARDNNEKVIIMGHHPPGRDSYIYTESRWLSQVVLDYADVIVLMVSGHTHVDDYTLFSDPSDPERTPKAMLHIAPAMTTTSSMGLINPGLRLFYLDPVTFEVLNYEQHFMDITDTTTEPVMVMRYSAKEEYDLVDMSPASWNELADRMELDDALFNKWFNHLTGGANDNVCDPACKRERLCMLRHSSYDYTLACQNEARDVSYRRPIISPVFAGSAKPIGSFMSILISLCLIVYLKFL